MDPAAAGTTRQGDGIWRESTSACREQCKSGLVPSVDKIEWAQHREIVTRELNGDGAFAGRV